MAGLRDGSQVRQTDFIAAHSSRKLHAAVFPCLGDRNTLQAPIMMSQVEIRSLGECGAKGTQALANDQRLRAQCAGHGAEFVPEVEQFNIALFQMALSFSPGAEKGANLLALNPSSNDEFSPPVIACSDSELTLHGLEQVLCSIVNQNQVKCVQMCHKKSNI